MTATATAQKVYRFRVLRGSLSQKEPGSRVPTIYNRGEVFQTSRNLEIQNIPGAPPRFEQVPITTPLTVKTPGIRGKVSSGESELPSSPQSQPSDTLDTMSIEDLRKHAAAEEIDLRGAKTKADIINVIRASL